MFEENLSQLLPETGRSRATNLKTQKKTKWIKMHQSKVKMCFLRGPLRWLTEQKNPKFLWSLQNAKHDTRIWLQVGIFWVDILNSASRILQCWSNYVKINSASISTRHRKNSKQSGIVAIDSCFALFGARQYGVTTRESFLGYLKLMLLFFVLYHFMLPGNFYYGSEIRHGIFWGINFGPAIFWGFVWSPRDFWGFWFFSPFDHPCHLNSGVPPMGLSYWKGRWIFHTFHPKLIYIFLIRNCVGESNEKTKSS